MPEDQDEVANLSIRIGDCHRLAAAITKGESDDRHRLIFFLWFWRQNFPLQLTHLRQVTLQVSVTDAGENGDVLLRQVSQRSSLMKKIVENLRQKYVLMK
jgi:hypothetical protein